MTDLENLKNRIAVLEKTLKFVLGHLDYKNAELFQKLKEGLGTDKNILDVKHADKCIKNLLP